MPLSIEWSLDPGLLLALASYLAIYVWRWRRVRAQVGPQAASAWRLASFTGGILVLFVALGSPIDGLGEQLFVFHMAQHVLLADLAAVLLLLGLTKVILRPVTAWSHRLERRLGPLATPVAGLLIYVGTLWLWHLPALYQLGLESPSLHPLQHVSLLGAALVFWWFVLSPIPARRPLKGMAVVFYIGSAKVLTGVLATLLTWSPVFFYDFYARQPRYLGLSAENDQALAGALMMTVDSLVLTIAVVVLFIKMLGESDREEDRLERYGPGSLAE
jgi:cytochrome c oxidase assembly factor CtaG